MTELFRTRRRVEFADTDMAGIAHFSNFFRWMESAEVDFLASRGLNVDLGWDGRHLGFPRVSASCDFVRPVTFMDVVEIEVRLERLGAKSVTYAFEFSKGGEIVARGRVTSVCCLVSRDGGIEAVEIPEGIRAKLSVQTP
jgi:YbgC/YbaW family acyl-CoA thioester hydrolase